MTKSAKYQLSAMGLNELTHTNEPKLPGALSSKKNSVLCADFSEMSLVEVNQVPNLESHMRKISALVSAAALAAVSSVAFAAGPAGFGGGQAASGQAGGPAGFGPATALNTVQAVTQSGLDEQRVVLTGKLTNYLGNDKYEFADSTGRIVVELDDDRNWSHIGKDQTITIYGETDVTPRAIEIDVTDAQVVK